LSHSTFCHLVGGGSVADHGSYAFDDYIGGLPFIDDERLLSAIQQIAAERHIDFIFPAHDSAVTLFARWAQDGAIGDVRVVTSPYDTCKVARSKSETYGRLRDAVSTPLMYGTALEVPGYPVFLKPDVGQGSKGIHKATNRRELDYWLASDPTLLILEYLPGREFTVDCFTDRHGHLKFAGARVRTRIMNGISVSTTKIQDSRFDVLAERINATLRFRGPWFFQMKERANGELVLMEIAARVAGASCYHRILGVNLPLLALFDSMDHDVDVFENPVTLEMDRQLQNRYKIGYAFGTVYVDLDDTLVEDGKVNHRMLGALYSLKSQAKTLCLLTRHLARHGEPAQALLKSLFIDPALFDVITEVSSADRKSNHVTRTGAIFIDDSFSERKDVAQNAGIPVFDVNQIIEVYG
jgi:hypothetical protein